MPLKLIVGPPNSGRAGEVRRRLDEALDREPVLVVPTGDDAAWFERELCAGGRPSLGVSIRTFGWLFEDVAAALALDAGPTLTGPQRLALVRAAISTTELRRLHRSAQRPGFAPALDSLIEELQAALISPSELAERSRELDDGAHEAELAELYGAYVALRRRSGRTDRGGLADAALAALGANPDAWGERPVFLYGFDDLTLAQRELVAALARTAEVTVAVNYADRRSLAARATLVSELRDELGAEVDLELVPAAAHTAHRSLLHLDRGLFEPEAGTVEPDEGVVLMECAGERGEAEAIGLELARLLADGVDPGEIAIVVRNPSGSGQVLAGVLSGYGIPVALEARAPVDRTGVGRALVELCRAAGPNGTAADLLAHLRADPSFEAAVADRVEERIRRGEVRTPGEVIEGWQRAPRHYARLRAAGGGAERLHALALIAREVAEGAHREQAPLAASGASGSAAGMLHPLELRAAVAAAELLSELATLGELPGCPEPGLEDAIEAIEGASVRVWRGPTDGRVRILSPYRLRAGRAGYLFCAGLQDGEFPAAAPPDPLLGDDRRARLGIAALARREQADEERYLFAACVSRPTERLYLCWRSCDEEGLALARSPFIDEVLDLLGDSPEDAETELSRSHGLEQVVPEPGEAPSERELARSLACRGAGDPAATLAAVGVTAAAAERVLAALAAIPDPAELPGPLRVEAVLEALGERRVLSANQLERWIECPYRWFVDHELDPVRLEPESDPLWLGAVVHDALANLYGEAPGEEAIPRPGDVGRWRARFSELLAEAVGEGRLGPERVAAVARAREQVDRFLSDEAASETELRPRPDLLERGFGMGDDDDSGGLDLGDFVLRGRIDRIDLARDGSAAVVRDYKTGARVTDAAKFERKGSLQIQLYMRAAEEMLEVEVIGGLYQPLGATKPANRRPRGLVLKGDERLAGLDLVRGSDHLDGEDFDEQIERAAERAREAGRELHSGEIGRRPLAGKCPKYCTFQPICRLERAIGLADENGGDEG
ncbi:MAG: PD-(D/E)XK nuclease family protein [bacterium]